MNVPIEKESERAMRTIVTDAITRGDVFMRPRWHFIVETILAIVLVLLVLLVLLYMASLTLFSLRASGAWFAPSFGLQGWYALIRAMPPMLLLITAAFVIVLEMLMRRYAFTYRRPLVYSVAGVILLIVGGGYLLDRTRMHDYLFQHARGNTLPVGGSFYRSYGREGLHDVHRGIIMEVQDDGFQLMNDADERLNIRIVETTRFPSGVDVVDGDDVVVFGLREDHTVTALGIRKANDLMHGPNAKRKSGFRLRRWQTQRMK